MILNFNHKSDQKLYLSEVIGTKYFPIDSAVIDEQRIIFSSDNYPVGYYKIHHNDTNIVDIIINKEDEIEITFTEEILQHGVEVNKSLENKLLWDYKYYSRDIQKKENALVIQRSYLMPLDSLYSTLTTKLDLLVKEKKEYLRSLSEEHKNTYFSKTVYASHPPDPLENQTSKEIHFARVNFSDPTLIRSAIFPGSMMEYLQRYTEYTEEGFQESIDYMLALAQQDQQVYEYCLNYLLEVFNLIGPDVIFDYLVENYLLEGGCSEANISESFRAITESYRKLMPGNKAPEFTISDTVGNVVSSQELFTEGDKNLLFFWSSHCPHCHETIPKVKQLEQAYNIIAVSLDTSKTDWIDYINSNNLSFNHFSELKGWDGFVNKKFKIHKTPSYYLIDKQGIILKKPKTVDELM